MSSDKHSNPPEEFDESDSDVEAIPFETLSAYLDDELSEQQRRRVEQWLEQSEEMRRELERMESVDQKLRRWSRDVSPGQLEQILKDPDTGQDHRTTADDKPSDAGNSPKPPPRNFKTPVVAAAVLATVVIAAAIFGVAPDDEPGWESWLDEIVADHHKFATGQDQMGLQTGDIDQVNHWFSSEYNLDISKPSWRPEVLQGANRCTLLEQPVAASYLDDGQRFISVYSIDPDMIASAPPTSDEFPGQCQVRDDVEICQWRQDQWQMVSVAETGDVSLADRLDAAVYSE